VVHVHLWLTLSIFRLFLADVYNGRPYATMLRPFVACNVCIVDERCILDQKLLLTTNRKSYVKNRLVPKCLTFVERAFKVMPTIASHSPLNISEIVRDRGWFQRTTSRKWPMASRMVMRPMTPSDPKGQTCDPNRLRAQYLENSWRCYLATYNR